MRTHRAHCALVGPDPEHTIRKQPVSRRAGVWPDPLARRFACLRECPVAGPDHEGCHRPDADDAWQTSAKAAGDCGEAPEGRKEVADQAAHGVHAPLRHIGAAFGDYGGGSDRTDRHAFVELLPVRGWFANQQAACCAFSVASRSATVALFCMPSISATRLIVSASARAKLTPPAPAMARSKACSAASTIFSAERSGRVGPSPPTAASRREIR